MFVCKVAGVLFIAFDIPLQGFLFAKVGVSVLFVHLYVCSRDNPHRVCVCVWRGGGVFVRQNSRFLLVYMLQRFKLTTL